MSTLRKREDDTPELAISDCGLVDFNYEKGQFRRYFTTPFTQHSNHIGKEFIVVKRLPDAEPVDEGVEGEDMWLIRFEGGIEIEAWGHEVCLLYEEDTREAVRQRVLKAIGDKDAPEGALDELVTDCKCAEASSINNDGFESQIDYLLDSKVSEEDILAALAESQNS